MHGFILQLPTRPVDVEGLWKSVQELVERLLDSCINKGYSTGIGMIEGRFGEERVERILALTPRDVGDSSIGDVPEDDESEPLLPTANTASDVAGLLSSESRIENPAGRPVPDQSMSRGGEQPPTPPNQPHLLPPYPFDKCHDCCQFAIEDPVKRERCLACTEDVLPSLGYLAGAVVGWTQCHWGAEVAGGILSAGKFLTGMIRCCNAKNEHPSTSGVDAPGRREYGLSVIGEGATVTRAQELAATNTPI
ncbi:hypothetical protein MMC11_004210 [Xylographa trunciseda]|nr:hypothetical protein [Xylographa trunciseda]